MCEFASPRGKFVAPREVNMKFTQKTYSVEYISIVIRVVYCILFFKYNITSQKMRDIKQMLDPCYYNNN